MIQSEGLSLVSPTQLVAHSVAWVRGLATALALWARALAILFRVRAAPCHGPEQILTDLLGATEGVGKTTKAVGDTGSGYINKATGKEQSADNPLGRC